MAKNKRASKPKKNKQYKSSVFCMLFSNEELLRELYCALEGVTIPPDTPININTLSNVLFMGRMNDISFEVGGRLVVLIEHQSTINPNMALRLLMYIGRVYEKTMSGDTIYSEKRLRIPRPVFFVLYNGTDPFPDEEVYRLSDSFEDLGPLGLSEHEKITLELEVRVLNINEGRNADIVHRCKKLAEYSAFIAKVREIEKELGCREKAIIEAVRYCRKNGILKVFLEEHGAEVVSMLTTEFGEVNIFSDRVPSK
jgi:hypothetical protein